MANNVSFEALQAVVAALVETGRVPASWAELADDPEALVNTIRSAGAVGVIDLSQFVLREAPIDFGEAIRPAEDATVRSLALIEPKETHLAIINRAKTHYYVAIFENKSLEEALETLTGGRGQVADIEAAATDWTDDGGYSLESGER